MRRRRYPRRYGRSHLSTHHRAQKIYFTARDRKRDGFSARSLEENAKVLRTAARRLRALPEYGSSFGRNTAPLIWADQLDEQAGKEEYRAAALRRSGHL